jgi:hypothetical protein
LGPAAFQVHDSTTADRRGYCVIDRTVNRGGASGQCVPRQSLGTREVRLALTAARKIGVATYQTALPDEKLIRARLEHFAWPRGDADE